MLNFGGLILGGRPLTTLWQIREASLFHELSRQFVTSLRSVEFVDVEAAADYWGAIGEFHATITY